MAGELEQFRAALRAAEPPPARQFDAYSDEPAFVLARLALQSDRYAEDPEFREATDAVLAQYGIPRKNALTRGDVEKSAPTAEKDVLESSTMSVSRHAEFLRRIAQSPYMQYVGAMNDGRFQSVGEQLREIAYVIETAVQNISSLISAYPDRYPQHAFARTRELLMGEPKR